MGKFVITPADRQWFCRCRRAWDLGARARRNLEPIASAERAPGRLTPAVRKALAVYYFPGMWTWQRSIVIPLVDAALDRTNPTEAERELVSGFAAWAPTVDDFTPVRVETDIDVAVADPVISERDLGTPEGDGVRFQERVPLVVIRDEDGTWWVVRHHVVDTWASADELALDEAATVTAWAWQQFELAMPIAGLIHDQLHVDGPAFRRTVIPLTPAEVTRAGRRLGRTAMAMLDAALRVDPTPDWTYCAECPFRGPCIAMNRDTDAEPLLASAYRARPPDEPEEGRLGGTTWSTGRGARPHLFGWGADRS